METTRERARAEAGPLAPDELRLIDAYWRAANYLAVGQIYLLENPLLRESLVPEHVKPHLLGHFGTTPGLNLVYVHLNRAIRARDLNALYVTGPGHGGPGIVANAYLEGTYSELYPVVGDGEAETGPLAASWHSNKFLNASTDGAVLPILHLNGYKIANPTVLARIPEEELVSLLEGYGWRPLVVGGDEPAVVHEAFATALDEALGDIAEIQQRSREATVSDRPRWPMLVLRTPKGWTGPKEVDGKPVEGTWRAHQVPLAEVRTNARHLTLLETWMKTYR